MKFYIACRFTKKEEVRQLQQKLAALGHEIAYDWTTHKDMRPFDKNQKIASEYAHNDIEGVRASDVFIALCDYSEGGVGMHTEIGAAISSKIEHGKPEIYIVGTTNTEALFYFHPLMVLLISDPASQAWSCLWR